MTLTTTSPEAPSGGSGADGVTTVHGAAAIEHLPMQRVNVAGRGAGGFIPTVREVWAYRELLLNLVRKELKVKYKDSVLGFLWSLMRPLFLLAVYYVAISKFLGAGLPSFAIFLFTGLVAWNLFTDVLGGCTGTIVGNAGLIKKVYFPRELLPLSVVGAALVQFLMQLLVLVVATAAFGRHLSGQQVWLLPMSFIVIVLFSLAVGFVLAAVNVQMRDTEHLIEVILLLWFWLSPIVYSVGPVIERLEKVHHLLATVYLMNPMANAVMGFQRAVYGQYSSNGVPQLYTGNLTLRLLLLMVISAGLVWLAQRFFARAQGNFAQEL